MNEMTIELRHGALLSKCTLHDYSIDTPTQYLFHPKATYTAPCKLQPQDRSALVLVCSPRQSAKADTYHFHHIPCRTIC